MRKEDSYRERAEGSIGTWRSNNDGYRYGRSDKGRNLPLATVI